MTPPVLFIIFNRPETTAKVFGEIRKARPRQLYIGADGPRSNKDLDKCGRALKIATSVDWDCEVHILPHKKNLGCGKAVRQSINWFFSNVEQGIILEDDCVPDQSFFPFCETMLDRYKDDNRIMMISGTNFLYNKPDTIHNSYYFSKYFPVWGWATWSRAWRLYDTTCNHPDLSKIYHHQKLERLITSMINDYRNKRLDTWDIQWLCTCLMNDGLAIIPKYNLISNIGSIGTHTRKSGISNTMPVRSIDTTVLKHPERIEQDMKTDQMAFDEITKQSHLDFIASIKKRIFGNILKPVIE